jgi:opacity protein-like surface antigen
MAHKKKEIFWVFVCVFCFLSSAAAHQSRVQISGGPGREDNVSTRISYGQNLKMHFASSLVGHFSPEVETGGGLWLTSDDTNFHADITPMLVYVFHTDWESVPFVEGGVGGAYIAHENFAGERLGSHFQFRDVLGMGLKFGATKRYSMRLRYVHYSNADLADENDGMDVFVLCCGFSF